MIAESAKFLASKRQKQNKRFMLPQGGERALEKKQFRGERRERRNI